MLWQSKEVWCQYARHELLQHDDKVGCRWAQHKLLWDNGVLCKLLWDDEVKCELLQDDEVKCKSPQLGYLQVEVAC